MPRNNISDEERASIIAYLREGKSQNWTAKEVGRSPSVVNRIAKSEGIENIPSPKSANAARRDYAKAERIALGNEMFDAVRGMVMTATTPGELKDLAVTFGTLTDKRRLDDNEPTNIGENRRGGLDLESEFRKLDAELDAETKRE